MLSRGVVIEYHKNHQRLIYACLVFTNFGITALRIWPALTQPRAEEKQEGKMEGLDLESDKVLCFFLELAELSSPCLKTPKYEKTKASKYQ